MVGGGWYGGHGTLADRVGGTVWEVPLVGWFGVWGQHLGLVWGREARGLRAGIGFGSRLCVCLRFRLSGQVFSVTQSVCNISRDFRDFDCFDFILEWRWDESGISILWANGSFDL